MKFLEILKELEKEEKNEEFIILIRCGAFFVAVGEDAMLLSKELGLKRICMKENLCKIGIPLSSIYDYINKIENLEYSFVIYNYSKDEMIDNGKHYAEAYRSIGKKKKEHIIVNCRECPRYENNINYNAIDIFDELNRINGLKQSENKIKNKTF